MTPSLKGVFDSLEKRWATLIDVIRRDLCRARDAPRRELDEPKQFKRALAAEKRVASQLTILNTRSAWARVQSALALSTTAKPPPQLPAAAPAPPPIAPDITHPAAALTPPVAPPHGTAAVAAQSSLAAAVPAAVSPAASLVAPLHAPATMAAQTLLAADTSAAVAPPVVTLHEPAASAALPPPAAAVPAEVAPAQPVAPPVDAHSQPHRVPKHVPISVTMLLAYAMLLAGISFSVFDNPREFYFQTILCCIASLASVTFPGHFFDGLRSGFCLRRAVTKLFSHMHSALCYTLGQSIGIVTLSFDKYTLRKRAFLPLVIFMYGVVYFWDVAMFNRTYAPHTTRAAVGIGDYTHIVIPHLNMLYLFGGVCLALCTDGDTNISRAALQSINSVRQTTQNPLVCPLGHLVCVLHLLNSIFADFYTNPVVARAVTDFTSLHAAWRSHPAAAAIVTRVTGHALGEPVDTRWLYYAHIILYVAEVLTRRIDVCAQALGFALLTLTEKEMIWPSHIFNEQLDLANARVLVHFSLIYINFVKKMQADNHASPVHTLLALSDFTRGIEEAFTIADRRDKAGGTDGNLWRECATAMQDAFNKYAHKWHAIYHALCALDDMRLPVQSRRMTNHPIVRAGLEFLTSPMAVRTVLAASKASKLHLRPDLTEAEVQAGLLNDVCALTSHRGVFKELACPAFAAFEDWVAAPLQASITMRAPFLFALILCIAFGVNDKAKTTEAIGSMIKDYLKVTRHNTQVCAPFVCMFIYLRQCNAHRTLTH